MQIVVFTNNQNKIKEIEHVFKIKEIEIFPYLRVFKEKIDVVEDGFTFEENVRKKIAVFKEQPNRIFLADDSGLEVDVLDGRPGIYSARYAGENATSHQMCEKLLAEMRGKKNRKANFICTLALKLPNGKLKIVVGKVFGQIIQEMRGQHGFGYDPVFKPDGCDFTFAEMKLGEKNKISHRARALQKALEEIKCYLRVGV